MSTDATALGVPTVPNGDLEELRAQLRGAAHSPADPGSAEVRQGFNAMHDGRPEITVQCTGTADVIDAVNFAREHGMDVAVRGGGHSIAGLSEIEGRHADRSLADERRSDRP